jgi:hypothetical protein
MTNLQSSSRFQVPSSSSSSSNQPVPVTNQTASASSKPKSLAELMKQRTEPLNTTEPTKERISSEPLVAWGDTGGPGRPTAQRNYPPSALSKDTSNGVNINGLSLNHSAIAPPIRHIRRNTFAGSPKSSSYASASSAVTGKYQSLLFPEVSYTPSLGDAKSSAYSQSNESDSSVASNHLNHRITATGSEMSVISEADEKLTQAMSTLREYHDQSTVNAVFRDVIQRDLGVSFDDIAALSTAKRLLNEAVVLPLIMPEFFTGIREPWKVGSF